MNIGEYLKNKFSEYKIDESNIRDFADAIFSSGLDIKNWEEIGSALKAIRNRNMSVDQFLKVSKYFEELMEHQFTLTTVKELNEYLNERYEYVSEKISYLKGIIELKKEYKALENKIRSMNSELRSLELQIAREKYRYDRL